MSIPAEHHWLFWDVSPGRLDVQADLAYILPRILEFGTLSAIRWALQAYGGERIHAFLRREGHPELGARTLAFWRAYFNAEDEPWASPPSWRRSSSAPWSG